MVMAGLQQRDVVEEAWVPESFSMPKHLGILIFAYVLSLGNFMLQPHYLPLDSPSLMKAFKNILTTELSNYSV